MLNLTEEQIDRAAEASYLAQVSNTGLAVFTDHSWTMIDSRSRNIVRDGVRAAAPFLQMPWELPTEREIANRPNGYGYNEARFTLVAFVNNRNAALLPKPVDPRRGKILGVLNDPSSASIGVSNSGLTDLILAALDAKEL